MKFSIRIISLIISISMTLSLATVQIARAEVSTIYNGIEEAGAIVKNMQFKDVEARGTAYWAKDAIYDMSALSIIKGYGDKFFNIDAPLTKVQALALIYRGAGKEDQAQKAANEVEEERSQQERRINAVEVWADGYIQLAFEDELITEEQFNDAMYYDQSQLNSQYNFIKTNPAQRQEVGEWIAKALELEPVYDQQYIFNSFNDWRKTDPSKIPYIEAVLKEKIMNGNEGYLHPTDNITREQMAQVLKNAEKFIFKRQNMTKKHGYIEEIQQRSQQQMGSNTDISHIKIRNSEGKQDEIITQRAYDSQNNIIETSNGIDALKQKEIVVLVNGEIGHSYMLQTGDEISYIADKSKNIRLVRILGEGEEEKIYTGIIKSTNTKTTQITMQTENKNLATYNVSQKAEIIINHEKSSFDKLLQEAPIEITVKNNLIIKIEVKAQQAGLDQNEITGIVEDINVSLGYISLYNEDGKKSFNLLRIYNFLNPYLIKVMRNGQTSNINNIQPGDSAFIKLDDNGYVKEIAASENYIIKYGKVMTKNPNSILVQYDDGSQNILNIDNDTLITKNRQISSYYEILPGSNIKMVIHQTDNFTNLKEISLETGDYYVNSIYKANIYYYDEYSSNLIVSNLNKLESGKWALTPNKGYIEIEVQPDAEIYYNNRRLGLLDINNYHIDGEVYIAAQKGPGGKESAVFVSLKDANDTERIYDDILTRVVTGTGEFKTQRQMETFKYSPSSIIIKNGKLITGNNLDVSDTAYLVTNRNYESGQHNAAIIQVTDGEKVEGAVMVYRGRIKSIKENTEFAIESFSQFNVNRLNAPVWNYYNTPKTFIITSQTRIIDVDGVVNNREFSEYSSMDYVDKVVNIVSDGINALLISEAPYGEHSLKGEAVVEHGQSASNMLTLKKVTVYDKDTGRWETGETAEIIVRQDTIILKNNKPASLSDILRGDLITVVKSDDDNEGEAMILIINN